MLVRKLIVASVVQMALFACLLFVPAGTLHWWRAWVLLAVTAVGAAATLAALYPRHKAVLAERLTLPIQENQPRADKIVVSLFLAAHFAAIVFIPLDVFHFHLMEPPGTALSWLGMDLFLVGWWIVYLALKANPFAAPAVRHQEERRQVVIDSGVYRFVRHPMYAGAILLSVGMPLWLGSYAATLAALVPLGLLALRCVLEERFLRRQLDGYDAYMKRVRFRLIPFVW